MGKTADDEPVKMKKESKKNKNVADDSLLSGNDNSHVETTGNRLKKKKKNKHVEKKSKLESKKDEETNDDGLKKKKKRDKHKSKSETKEDGEKDGESLKKKKDKHKSKSEAKDGDEDQHDEGNLVNNDSPKKNKKRKRKHASEEAQIDENQLDKKKKKQKDENNKKKSKSKKVSFSGHVEVFPTSDTEPVEQTKGDGLIRGKRFTPEEDEIVKKAVLDYIVEKGLGDEGLKMVLNCSSHKGMKKCWQEIGLCIPYRPYSAVYYRAHILFERAETRSWTPEEIQLLKDYHKKYGNDWKKIAEELGKHRFHVKDTWRRIKFENLKSGRWSQEEYQNLYDLVNLDLQMKINGEEKKKSKHGMLRDNIPWTAISEKLATRTDATCCVKWYNQLTSSLVVEKKWSDADDYRMIGVLYELDATCIEDVEWDDVLEHRPGEICLKRWHQMVKYIGDYRSKSFGEQVDILAKRYCPDLAETRATWDNKPVVG